MKSADEEVGQFSFESSQKSQRHLSEWLEVGGEREVSRLPTYLHSDVLMKECLSLSLYCIIFGNRNNIHMHFLSNLTEMESYP